MSVNRLFAQVSNICTLRVALIRQRKGIVADMHRHCEYLLKDIDDDPKETQFVMRSCVDTLLSFGVRISNAPTNKYVKASPQNRVRNRV